MTEEDEQNNYMRSDGQSSLSEDDGEQVSEMDNLVDNEEYEQARIIEVGSEISNEVAQIRNWAILNNNRIH